MTPIRESSKLDWEGEHMQPNFEKLWRETQQQFNKMEARAIRLEANAQRLADALAPFADLLENPDEYRGARADLVVHVADIKAAVKALAQWEAYR